MNLQETHVYETNRTAYKVGTFIIWLIFILGILGLAGGTIPKVWCVARGILTVVTFIQYTVCYNIYKTSQKYIYIGGASIMFTYLILIFTTTNQYMYALMFPIMLYIVLYMNKRFALFSCIAYSFCNLIVAVKFMMKTVDKSEPIVNAVLAIATCIIGVIIVQIQDRHKSEDMGAIEEFAAEQQKMSEKTAEINKQIGIKVDESAEVSETLTDCIESTLAAFEQISSGTRMNAESVSSQAEMTDTIRESLENISAKTEEMLANSQNMNEIVTEGNDLVHILEEKAKVLSKTNEETADLTKELQNNVKSVNDIIAAILSISEQTNLLALNASIEAARAGEAGKGFAVVASEIRQLSEQTKSSAEKIQSTINGLVANINVTSDNIHKTIGAVDDQNTLIENVGKKFEHIYAITNALTSQVEEVTGDVTECVESNTKVVDSISTLSAASEEVSASTDNSVSMMEECKEKMDSMNQIMEGILALTQQ